MGHPLNEIHERPGRLQALPAFIQPLEYNESTHDDEFHELCSVNARNDTWVGLQRAASLYAAERHAHEDEMANGFGDIGTAQSFVVADTDC
jgi:hypothetical protein